jgi:hypothetical protein
MGRHPSSGFESSVDECSNWCSITDGIDTDRRSCRPESRAGLTAKPPAAVALKREIHETRRISQSIGLGPKEAVWV